MIMVVQGNMRAQAQAPPDSVIKKYAAGNYNEKYSAVYDYLFTYYKSDSLWTKKSLELIAYFNKQNDGAGVDFAKLFLAFRASWKSDYATVLSICFPLLSDYKARNDTAGIYFTLDVICRAYEATKNYAEEIKYQKQFLLYYDSKDKRSLMFTYQSIATVYAEAFMPDSGLVYAQQALNIAYELKRDTLLIGTLATVAENYIARGDYDLAMPFMRKAMLYKHTIRKQDEAMMYTWTNNDFAQAYLGMKQYDSAIYYSRQSLLFSMKDLPQQLRSCEYLYKSYDAMGKADSSNKYFRRVTAIKDSLTSTEKIKAIEATGFREQLHQQEMNAEKIMAADERWENIELALMAMGIVTFMILFFMLSRSIVVNEKIISFLGILGLLIVFEFVNLLIHPLLERKTNHSPPLMLLAMVVIASLLIPVHHRMERWIKEKMTEKNKRVRLTAAKKTIEKLEGKQGELK